MLVIFHAKTKRDKNYYYRDKKLLFITPCNTPPLQGVIKSTTFYPTNHHFAVNKVE